MTSQTYRKCERLQHRREFQAVFEERCSAGAATIVVYGRPNSLPYNRLGLSVGRRFGNAVRRNRFKRLCRESFRTTKPDQPQGWDWIMLPRIPKKKGKAPAPAPPLTLLQIRDEFLNLVEKLSARRSATKPSPPADGPVSPE